jgi:DNA-binding NarL/FixJ family response regulator
MVATEKKKQLIRILIIDDHQMVRDGIKVMLESQHKVYKFIVSEAESGEDGIKKVMKNHYDMLLVDYQLPGLSGAETVQKIKLHRPDLKIMALSNYDELTYITKMINAGAHGYVLKNIEPTQLINAINTILSNKRFFSNEVAVKLIEREKQERKVMPIEEYGVTEREVEILKMIASEMTNDEIAETLDISKRTVDAHRQNLLHKLRVRNTVGLIKIAMELRLIKN